MKPFLTALIMSGCILTLAAKPHTPASGTPERKAICDAMREHVLNQSKKPLAHSFLFKVEFMKVEGDYAAFEGFPVKPDGSNFPFETFGDVVFTTFLKKGKDGAWKVVSDLTRTDVPSDDEVEQIRAKFPKDFPAAVMPAFWRKLLRP